MAAFKKFDLERWVTAKTARIAKQSHVSDISSTKISGSSGISRVTAVQKPRPDTLYKLPLKTAEEVLAVPLRPCVWCAHYTFHDSHCAARDWRMPEPTRECRCVWYKARH